MVLSTRVPAVLLRTRPSIDSPQQEDGFVIFFVAAAADSTLHDSAAPPDHSRLCCLASQRADNAMAPPTHKKAKTTGASDAAPKPTDASDAAPAALAAAPAVATAAAPSLAPAMFDGQLSMLAGGLAFAFDAGLRSEKQDDKSTRETEEVAQGGELPSSADLEAVAAHVRSGNPSSIQQQGTIQLRQLLSREKDPPIDAVVRLGVVPDLVRLLECDDNPELQFEALWALTNIASSDHVIEITGNIPPNSADAVPQTARLLRSPSHKVREQAIWCVLCLHAISQHRVRTNARASARNRFRDSRLFPFALSTARAPGLCVLGRARPCVTLAMVRALWCESSSVFA